MYHEQILTRYDKRRQETDDDEESFDVNFFPNKNYNIILYKARTEVRMRIGATMNAHAIKFFCTARRRILKRKFSNFTHIIFYPTRMLTVIL